ncbi:endolytic transglycosylase MltG [Sulfurovum sp.]|uniref:endolytic transglycosylase MltG n=1 Tax=Sulfurovum sp. TaxID=1969726 RepID=UPI002867C570|nr:endolytic transglycosylase MltG [Sulfurovum sp.]
MKKLLTAKYKRYILYIEFLALILALPLAYNFIPLNKGTKTFYISSSNIDCVIQTLKINGYEVTAIDKWMLNLKKIPDEGWYSIQPNKYGRFLFFQHLYKQKTNDLMDVVVYAGETKNELTARLANDMKLEQKKLLSTYNMLAYFQEGDILSQRYTVARKADEDTTMKYLFLISGREIEKFNKEYFSKTPSILELKVIYIIASIIQKESNSVDEMPLISSVIYNRLEKNMRLQMDGTLNYGEFSHTLVTPERIKNDKSAYNTYKHKGLPPHPLSTITLDALKASSKPAQSDYLFFMLNQNGTHDFSAEYTKHLSNIRSFRIYQREKKMKEEEELKEIKKLLIEPLVEKLPYEDLDIEIDWEKVKM